MPEMNFPKVQGIRQFDLLEIQHRKEANEAKIVFKIKVSEKLKTLLKRTIPQMEGFAKYMRIHPGKNNTSQMVILVSCRDYDDIDQMVYDFTVSFLEAIQSVLETRANAVVEVETPIPITKSVKGRIPPIHRRASFHSVR